MKLLRVFGISRTKGWLIAYDLAEESEKSRYAAVSKALEDLGAKKQLRTTYLFEFSEWSEEEFLKKLEERSVFEYNDEVLIADSVSVRLVKFPVTGKA